MKKYVLSLTLGMFLTAGLASAGTLLFPSDRKISPKSDPSRSFCQGIANKIMSPGGIPVAGAPPWHAQPLTADESAQQAACRKLYPELFIPRP